MTKKQYLNSGLVLAGLLMLQGCVTSGPVLSSPPGVVPPSEEHNSSAPLGFVNPRQSFSLVLTAPESMAVIGNPLRLYLKSERGAFMSLFEIGASGNVKQLMDNQLVEKTREPFVFPTPFSPVVIRFAPPPGQETYILVAIPQPVRWFRPEDLGRSLGGGITELNLNGKELLNRLHDGVKRYDSGQWGSTTLRMQLVESK